jgi:chromosome partitioning protein
MSEKGGTGKTTSAVNTAVGLAKLGRRVLMVDADPQGNASLVLLGGREPAPDEATLFHVLTDAADAADTIRQTATAGLELMPADTRLADANVSLASEVGRERRLRLAMRGVDEAYDFVIVDTSPQRSLINTNVLNYVAEVLAPVDPGIFSLAGLVKLQGAVAEVVKYLDNQSLRIAGLVVTRAANDNISRDVEAQLRATFGALVYETTVPANTKVGEAHARFLSVLDYAPRSPGAQAYEALTREILKHGHAQHGAGGGVAAAVDDTERRPGRAGRRPRRAAG